MLECLTTFVAVRSVYAPSWELHRWLT